MQAHEEQTKKIVKLLFIRPSSTCTAWYNQNWHVPLSRGKRLINRRNMVKCLAGHGYYCHTETTMKGEKGREGEYSLPYPRTRAYAHSRVYRKSSFASAGRGKTLMSTATSVDRITASEAQEGRNVYFKTCDSGPFLLFVGGIDQHWEDHAGPIS